MLLTHASHPDPFEEYLLNPPAAANHNIGAHPELVESAAFDLSRGRDGPTLDGTRGFHIADHERAILANHGQHAVHGFPEVGRFVGPMQLPAVFTHEWKREFIISCGQV